MTTEMSQVLETQKSTYEFRVGSWEVNHMGSVKIPGEDQRLFQEMEISDDRPKGGNIAECHCFMVRKAPKFSLQRPRKRLATNKGFASMSKVGEV